MINWTPPLWKISDLNLNKLYHRDGYGLSLKDIHDIEIEFYSRVGPQCDWGENLPTKKFSPSHKKSILILGGAGTLGQALVKATLEHYNVYVVSRNPIFSFQHPNLHIIKADLTQGHSWMSQVPKVSRVYHLTAHLHAFMNWRQLFDVNVKTVYSAIQIASRDDALLTLASTLSVMVSGNWEPAKIEELPIANDVSVFGGYAQTKAMAEFAIRRYPRHQIIRYGLLVPDNPLLSNDYPVGHFIPAFRKSLLEFGYLPDTAEDASVDLTNVNSASLATLIDNPLSHFAQKSYRLADWVDTLMVEQKFTFVSKAEWLSRVQKIPGLPRYLLLSAFFKSEFLDLMSSRPYFNVDLFQATQRDFCCQ